MSERVDLDHFLGDLERLGAAVARWDETPRAVATAQARAVESLYGEALRRLIRALKSDPACLAALRTAVQDDVVYAVLRREGILKASLNERVESALEGVRPMLASHGGDVELVSIEPPAVSVRFLGACDGCPASALTFHEGVAKAVKDACPEITSIVQLKGSLGGARQTPPHEREAPPISPFELLHRGSWRRATDVTQIPEGGVHVAWVRGESLLLARLGGAVTCFDNACAHLGMPLEGGQIRDGILTCPHHGFAYDLSSGECLTAPSVGLRAREVRVVGDHVDVRVTT